MANDNTGRFSGGWRMLINWSVMAVLVAATVGLLALWNLPALSDWHSARTRLDAARARVERQREIVARLESEKQALASDQKALERAAREEYLLLKPGEEVYVFTERRASRH